MNYRKINNLLGWATGFIAYIVYLKTMEPTASFWDCGEFLACANRLEVGHSPGAPFFMLLQRLFGMFSPSPAKTAIFINSLSALTSALTILFLFWTITCIAKKLIGANDEIPDRKQTLLIIGAGLVGALAYAFSDTFWFSAVEAEVYGTSSFFTAITFWSIFKWEKIATQKYADRWLLLIAYLIGISLGVHLLNLLCIPAIAMVYYFKRYKTSYTGITLAFLTGCAILGFVQFGIIQYIPVVASEFDIFFTNTLGFPFDAGSITFLLLLSASLVLLLLYTRRNRFYLLNTAVLCTMFIIIGYSSYIVPVIRSRADVPIDMTNPDNALSLESYVSREQFGEQPIFYGQDYCSPVISVKSWGDIYSQVKENGKDHYEVTGSKQEPVYDPSSERFFPRLYEGSEAVHSQFYKEYLGLGDNDVPTATDNLKYFFGYQMNWLWWRYFMWNYVGRQNDYEGQGEPKNGNWISGISFLDKPRIGDINKMPDGYSNNLARNQLYCLPFILGILGMLYHFNRSRKDAFIVLILFFFTGAAIGIYLNMPPLQPRERDYAFAGCTYAFAIWIGLGVIMVQQWMARILKGNTSAYLAIALCLLCVPALMAKEEWNDHDRSNKTLARAVAYNTLMSCAPNAILFTFGDNDTFPLWYLQEVEGIRRDVRIMITTLLGTDWFIDQLNYKINDADAVPMLWKREDYLGLRHDYVRYYNNSQIPQNKYLNISDVCKFMVSDNIGNKLETTSGETENYLPTKQLYVPGLNKDELVQRGLLNVADTNKINNIMKFVLPKDALYKNDIAMLNIIAANAQSGWKRPIYFNGDYPGSDNTLGMGSYMKQEGLVYRLVPYTYNDTVKSKGQESGIIDVDKSYDLFMDTYLWGGADRNDVYFDEKNRYMFLAYRIYAAQIADKLSSVGRTDDAVKLLDKVMKNITATSYPYDYSAYYIAVSYYRAGARQKGAALSMKVSKNCEDDIRWINTLGDLEKESEARDARSDLSLINSLNNIAHETGDEATAVQLNQEFKILYASIRSLIESKNNSSE